MGLEGGAIGPNALKIKILHPNDEIKNPTLTFKKSPGGIGTSLFAVNDVGDRSTGNMRTSGRPALR